MPLFSALVVLPLKLVLVPDVSAASCACTRYVHCYSCNRCRLCHYTRVQGISANICAAKDTSATSYVATSFAASTYTVKSPWFLLLRRTFCVMDKFKKIQLVMFILCCKNERGPCTFTYVIKSQNEWLLWLF
jgi:hypothetical protein